MGNRISCVLNIISYSGEAKQHAIKSLVEGAEITGKYSMYCSKNHPSVYKCSSG